MAVAGLRGTGTWSADERPTNYRETILYLNPNTKATLTALLGKLKEEVTDDPEFNIFLKDLPDQRAVVSGTHADSATTIALVTAADNTIFKPGHVVMNERTQELVWVTSAATSGEIVVIRARGGTSAAQWNDQDGLLIVGSAHPESAEAPDAISYDPTVVTNYTQIFRNSVHISRTARYTRLRTGDALRELRRETLELHGIEMEKAFFWGGIEESTSAGGGTSAAPKRTTKGIYRFLSTNVTDFSDAVTIDAWENFLEDVFENGSSEKMCFLGNRALNVINKLARNNGTINIVPTSETFGMTIMQYQTPFGVLYLKQHPLFSANPTFNDWGFVLDLQKLVYRPLVNSDTQYLTNRADNGEDGIREEYLTEAGLELQFESCHGVFKNASAYAA